MLVRIAFTLSLLLGLSTTALAQNHAYIDQSRSSLRKNMFLTTSVEGEYGRYQKIAKEGGGINTESWRGYGIRNGLGVEVMRFTQFSLSHTLLNMRSNDSGLENLTGSRLSAEIAFSFSAPLTNIQFGLGAIASQLQYQMLAKSSSFAGTGHYYTMGTNYFFSPSISMRTDFKRIVTDNKMTGGSSDYRQLKANTDSLSLGIAVWL
ncbi:MAG: hypothetical protein H7318_14895 [Oligoflexus sp.]|nr:hypothetical protein [Oligoflexus sp.]